MKKILILLLGLVATSIAFCGETFYFGGTLSASSEFGASIIGYLREPSKQCGKAYLDRNGVMMLHGNGLAPDDWVSTGEGREEIYRNLVQKEYLGRPASDLHTALTQLFYERGKNPQRRIVWEVGDSVNVEKLPGLAWDLRLILDKMGSTDWLCTVLIPLPDRASPELKEQVLEQVESLRRSCHVFVLNDTPEAAEPRSAEERVAALLDEAKLALCSLEAKFELSPGK